VTVTAASYLRSRIYLLRDPKGKKSNGIRLGEQGSEEIGSSVPHLFILKLGIQWQLFNGINIEVL
jgi:hypothetical protein